MRLAIKYKTLLLISLFFINYVAFIGFSFFPTWRIFNLIFVLASVFYFKKVPVSYTHRNMFVMIIIFFSVLFFQILTLIILNRITPYDIFFLVSQCLLFLFTFYFYALVNEDFKSTIQVIQKSIILLFVYQIFQFITYHSGFETLTPILNEFGIAETPRFFRMVGELYGPQGFMGEASQVTLFVGPFLMFMIISNYYGFLSLSISFLIICLISMLITLNALAFIEIAFISITFFITNKLFTKKNLLIISIAIVLIAFLILSNATYFDLILYKINNLGTDNDIRHLGAEKLWEAFRENPIFGVAPKSSRYVDADPNSFMPTLFADHGLLGGVSFLLLFILPILLVFIKSSYKLFIIPYLALFIHLVVAYGTFSWPLIWTTYVLVLYGLGYKPNNTNQ